MTNKEKIEALKAFLKENNFEFEENYISIKPPIVLDLFVKKLRIAVHVSDENDQNFFKKTKRFFHPFFVRESETLEFTIEKMQNCIIEEMQRQQKNLMGQSEAEENRKRHDEKPSDAVGSEKPRRKRVKIKYERVTRK